MILFLCMVLGSVLISFFYIRCPVFPAPLIEESVFLYCMFLPSLTIGGWVYLWAIYPIIVIYFCFFACTVLSWLLLPGYEIGEVYPPTLSFFSIVFTILCPLNFHVNFRIFVFCKEVIWDFNRDCTDSVHHLESSNINILTLSLPTLRHGICLNLLIALISSNSVL